MIKTASNPDQTSVQKVKESGHLKRANFVEEHKSGAGSFIKDEDPHNSFTNNNRTKVATSKRSEEVLDTDAFEYINEKGWGYRSKQNDERIRGKLYHGLNHIRQSAL